MSKRFLIEYELGVSRKVERAQVLSGEKHVSPAVEKMNQIKAATRRRHSAAIAAHKALTQPPRTTSSSKLSIETDFVSPTYARPQSPKPAMNTPGGLSIDVNFTPGERPSSRNGSSRPVTNSSAKVESMETSQDRILQKLAMSPYRASPSAKSPKLRPISQGTSSVLRLHRMVAQLEKNPIPVSASRPPPSPIGRRSPNRRQTDLQHMLELTDVYNIPLEVIETQVSPAKPIPALSPVSSPSRPKSGVTRPLSAVKQGTLQTPSTGSLPVKDDAPVKEDPPAVDVSQPPEEAESNLPQVESKENEAGDAVEATDKPGTDGGGNGNDEDDAAGDYGDDFYDEDNAGSSKKATKESEPVPTAAVESTPSTDGVEESKSGQSARPVDVPPTEQPTAPVDTAKPIDPPPSTAPPATTPLLSQTFEVPKPSEFIPITPAHIPALPLSLAEHRASQRSVHSRSMQSRGSRKSAGGSGGMDVSASSAAACPSFYRTAKGLERDIHRLEQIEAGVITADEWTKQFNGHQELPRWNDRFGFDRSALAKAEIPKLGHEHRQMQLQEHLLRLQQKKEKREQTASTPERPPRRPKSAAPASPSQMIADLTAPKSSKEPRPDEDGPNIPAHRTGSQKRKRRSSAGGSGVKPVPLTLTSTSAKEHRPVPGPSSTADHDDGHDDGKFF